MNQVILNDNAAVYYVIVVNGREVSTRFTTEAAASVQLSMLTEETRQIATIEPVTADGARVLLG